MSVIPFFVQHQQSPLEFKRKENPLGMEIRENSPHCAYHTRHCHCPDDRTAGRRFCRAHPVHRATLRMPETLRTRLDHLCWCPQCRPRVAPIPVSNGTDKWFGVQCLINYHAYHANPKAKNVQIAWLDFGTMAPVPGNQFGIEFQFRLAKQLIRRLRRRRRRRLFKYCDVEEDVD